MKQIKSACTIGAQESILRVAHSSNERARIDSCAPLLDFGLFPYRPGGETTFIGAGATLPSPRSFIVGGGRYRHWHEAGR
jgi:hypothetical protein